LQEALLKTLQHNTRLAVASGLTLAAAQLRSNTVKNWRQQPLAPDKETPAVYAIGR
jgi:16S rRNA (cytidine1402-2'-O)-methyltransferase